MSYSATITASSKELTKRERIQLKDMTDVIRLDSATKEGDVIINKVENIVEIDIHNDKATPTDYKNIIVVADDGKRYATGSTSFRNALFDIADDMEDEEPDENNLRIEDIDVIADMDEEED